MLRTDLPLPTYLPIQTLRFTTIGRFLIQQNLSRLLSNSHVGWKRTLTWHFTPHYHFLTITGTFCLCWLVSVCTVVWSLCLVFLGSIECIFVQCCSVFVKVFYLISFHQRIIYSFLWQILSLALTMTLMVCFCLSQQWSYMIFVHFNTLWQKVCKIHGCTGVV